MKADCAGGSPCTNCPDKRQCGKTGCVRKPEFIRATDAAQPAPALSMDHLPHQDWCRWWKHGDLCNCGAVDAAQPAPEPVAWMSKSGLYPNHDAIPARDLPPLGNPVPLFSAPVESAGGNVQTAKDAERYRWLREQNASIEPEGWVITSRDYTDEEGPQRYWVGSDLDAAIDAARAQEAAAPEGEKK